MQKLAPCDIQTMGGEDRAEQVDDLICVMDKVMGSQVDTLLVLLAGSHLAVDTAAVESLPIRSVHLIWADLNYCHMLDLFVEN